MTQITFQPLYPGFLHPAAQLALTSAMILDHFQNPAFDFLIGFLLGFSLVGSLVYLCFTTWRTSSITGVCLND
jgi:hypothetical protein